MTPLPPEARFRKSHPVPISDAKLAIPVTCAEFGVPFKELALSI